MTINEVRNDKETTPAEHWSEIRRIAGELEKQAAKLKALLEDL